MSTAKGEYIACSTAVQKALWLKYFLSNLESIGEKEPIPINVDRTSEKEPIPINVDSKSEKKPITINVDSTSAIFMVNEQNFNSRSKHVEIKYHFIREKVDKK